MSINVGCGVPQNDLFAKTSPATFNSVYFTTETDTLIIAEKSDLVVVVAKDELEALNFEEIRTLYIHAERLDDIDGQWLRKAYYHSVIIVGLNTPISRITTKLGIDTTLGDLLFEDHEAAFGASIIRIKFDSGVEKHQTTSFFSDFSAIVYIVESSFSD
jgi:hypothetical protein